MTNHLKATLSQQEAAIYCRAWAEMLAQFKGASPFLQNKGGVSVFILESQLNG